VDKNLIKKISRIGLFIAIANLPFITTAQFLGIDTFIDSFENPNAYYTLTVKGNHLEPTATNGQYLIIQKSTHPQFSIHTGDLILYIKENEGIACHKISSIATIGSVKTYYTTDEADTHSEHPIYNEYIIGKVINIIDRNPWTILSIHTWDISINNLNLRTLFINT
jgi:hypothetical protein